jgi:hypothetical protein
MSEQYAFAIGFDVESDEADQLPDDHWKGLYEQIGKAIRESGLPSIESERWDEFGQGRIFWGTTTECEAVRRILEPFDVYVEEARNLDPGYYTTPNDTYYVSDTGLIHLLPSDLNTAPLPVLEIVDSIPLDSYRMKVVDPEFHAKCQALLGVETNLAFEGDSISEEETKIDPQVHEALQAELAQLTTQLSAVTARSSIERQDYETLQQTLSQQNLRETALELKLKEVESQLHQWKQQAEAAIQPEAYASLQQQLDDKTTQIQDLQTFTKSLQEQLHEATALVSQKIDPSRYKALEQDVADKATLIADLRRTVQQLEREAKEWQTVANAKVERSQHQALEEELQQLKLRQSKGLFSRLFG